MAGRTSDWKGELERFLAPFLARLGHKARRQMCPVYVSGLIGPGDRRSIQPIAERLAAGDYDQLHHFIAAGIWDAKPILANAVGKILLLRITAHVCEGKYGNGRPVGRWGERLADLTRRQSASIGRFIVG